MGKKKNVFLERLTESEVNAINGGGYVRKCPNPPPYIRPGNSSAYIAWLEANCKWVNVCTPNTWTYCP
ncbi:hypothetical protein [Clostridium botulinum]|uniref:hypothetical protein n=1 Tax=Clostridium botulinum TaxID=1491 RepID=UPI000A1731E3|nr:hypothetical protein [Clostridium botulinum]OSA79046.1 hypothetical protein B2H89_11185 [Clostridium botulinum]